MILRLVTIFVLCRSQGSHVSFIHLRPVPNCFGSGTPPKRTSQCRICYCRSSKTLLAMGALDVDNTMHDPSALLVCLWLDDRCPPRRKVTTVCLRYLRSLQHLSFLYATDLRRTANMAELAVMTTFDRTAWRWRSSTVCD